MDEDQHRWVNKGEEHLTPNIEGKKEIGNPKFKEPNPKHTSTGQKWRNFVSKQRI
jgi:hypothetical protein